MKRRPEMDTNGFYGDTFSSGWGDFYPARKRSYSHQFHNKSPRLDSNKLGGLKRNIKVGLK